MSQSSSEPVQATPVSVANTESQEVKELKKKIEELEKRIERRLKIDEEEAVENFQYVEKVNAYLHCTILDIRKQMKKHKGCSEDLRVKEMIATDLIFKSNPYYNAHEILEEMNYVCWRPHNYITHRNYNGCNPWSDMYCGQDSLRWEDYKCHYLFSEKDSDEEEDE